MTLIVESQERCKKCFHFQVCSSVLKNDLLIREVMLGEKEPKCKMFVEVVPCKDCKQWCRNSGITESPNAHCFYHDIETNGYDYCSYGERKDNG